MTGKVKWFDAKKGFGFIIPQGEHPEVFVHHSAIEGKGYKSLNEHDQVDFRVEQGTRGPKAVNVRVLQPT